MIIYKEFNITKYISFITECSLKDYSNINTHSHHIIPKFMGGSNTAENIIILSYKDHFDAHLILAECFSENTVEYKGNIYAANHIKRWLDSPVDLKEKLSKAMKGRVTTPESIEKMKNTKIKNGTNKHSEKTKLKMSQIRKGSNVGSKNSMYGKEVSESTRLKISKANTGSDNGMFGKNHKEESLQKMSNNRKGITSGTNHPLFGKTHSEEARLKISKARSRKIKNLETGEVFESIKVAATHFQKSITYIRTRLEKGIFIYL